MPPEILRPAGKDAGLQDDAVGPPRELVTAPLRSL